MSKAQPVTDAEWETEVLQSDTPVLVDFWAEWCGPCHRIAPIVDEVADEKAGSLKVLKMDIDANPTQPRQYGIMSIPTLVVFKGGEEVKRMVGGARSKAELLSDVEPFLS
jgi:thioredoxin 1